MTATTKQDVYVVLSIGDLKQMMKKVRRESGSRDNDCAVFRSMVEPDTKGKLQIFSYDLACK